MATKSVIAGVVLSMLVPVCGFWNAYAEHRRLSAEQTRQPRPEIPDLVNGLRFVIDEHVSVEFQEAPAGFQEGGRRLVLATADTCAACVRVLPAWLDFLRSVAFRPHDEVVVVSYDGTASSKQLADVAIRRGIAVRIVRPINRYELWCATGLGSTPTMIVLDGTSRIRYSSHTLDRHGVEFLSRYFEGNGETLKEVSDAESDRNTQGYQGRHRFRRAGGLLDGAILSGVREAGEGIGRVLWHFRL